MLRRLTLAAAVFAVVALAASCGESDPAVSDVGGERLPAVAERADTKTYRPAGGGYEIAVPRGWHVVDAASIADDLVDASTEANPELAPLVEGFAAQIEGQPGAMFAFDDTPTGRAALLKHGFANNVVARRVDLNADVTDAEARDALADQIAADARSLSTLESGPSVKRAAVGGQPALAVTYAITLETARGDQVPVRETDYVIVRDNVAYQLAVTSTLEQADEYRETFERVVRSFRLV